MEHIILIIINALLFLFSADTNLYTRYQFLVHLIQFSKYLMKAYCINYLYAMFIFCNIFYLYNFHHNLTKFNIFPFI